MKVSLIAFLLIFFKPRLSNSCYFCEAEEEEEQKLHWMEHNQEKEHKWVLSSQENKLLRKPMPRTNERQDKIDWTNDNQENKPWNKDRIDRQENKDRIDRQENSPRRKDRHSRNSVVPQFDRRSLATQMTDTLNHLFVDSGYDKRFRPNMNGPPTVIEVNMYVRSLGPVDESKQIFKLDCYFRQFWMDDRLSFNDTNTHLHELAMNWQFLAKIWRPDTFFLNGRDSYLHKFAVPNRFIRISPSGRISYSQRLTITARCQMNLRKFPIDSQKCPLYIGSFAYSDKEVEYQFVAYPGKALTLNQNMTLPQYYLGNWSSGKKIDTSGRNGNRSVIFLTFQFDRAVGFYLLQIYIPLTIIVMSSWVSFWLVKTEKGQETPARTQLGATTVLAVVTIGFGGKAKPQVAYATALDVFIVICLASVFFAFIEFSFINFLDMFIRRLKHRDLVRFLTLTDMTRSMTAPLVHIQNLERGGINAGSILQKTGDEVGINKEFATDELETKNSTYNATNGKGNNARKEEPQPSWATTEMWDQMDKVKEEPEEDENCMDRIWRVVFDGLSHFNWLSWLRRTQLYHNTTEVIHNLDAHSRKMFPTLFAILNIIYWTGYVYF